MIEKKNTQSGPHDPPFGSVEFNQWETENILEVLWDQYRALEHNPPEGADLEAFKVSIRKLQNLKHYLVGLRKALAYRAKPFREKTETSKETA